MVLEQVHLVRDDERVEEIELLAASYAHRVGLDGVLDHLDRRARRQPLPVLPGRAVSWGFALDLADSCSSRWWPQGITSSADHDPGGRYAGREVVVTSSYAKSADGANDGSRLTFFDVTGRGRVRYRHVLLVEAVVGATGVELRPVRIHAGGIVWHGPYVHVAGTARGIFTFRLDDILRVPSDRADGHDYVVPVRFTHKAVTADGFERMRYSFLSLDRSSGEPELLAGEYGRGEQTTRLVRYPMDASGLVATDETGVARPVAFDLDGIARMQGAVRVEGRFYVSQSRGRIRRGHLYVGSPGDLDRHECALPPGPEDLCHVPGEDELWCPSEHPLLRYVVALDRSALEV